MTRPFALVGFTYLLVLAAAVFIGSGPSLLCGCFCAALFLALLVFPRTRKTGILPLAAVTAALAFGTFSICFQTAELPGKALEGREAVVEGRICELPEYRNGQYSYVLETDRIDLPDAPRVQRLSLTSYRLLPVEPYSRLVCTASFYLPGKGEGYSYRSYCMSRGIRAFARLREYEDISISPPESVPLYGQALRFRERMISSIRETLPQQEASLICGVLLGDKSGLTEEVLDNFRAAGISHLLAVSGLHMATMAQFFFLFFCFLRFPRRIAAGLSAVGVLCFMAVTGFVPSVMRSGIMCLIYLAGILLNRESDSLNSLGAAVLLLSLFNPLAAADTGLLLSFSATLGIILLAGPVSGFLQKWHCRLRWGRTALKTVNLTVSTSLAAILATLPVVILSFGTVSLIAPLTNVFVLAPSTLMIQLSAAASVLSLTNCLLFAAMPLMLLAGLLAKYVAFCASLAAQIPGATVSASYGFVALWLAGTFLLAGFAVLTVRGKRAPVIVSLLSVILLFCGIFSHQVFDRGVLHLAVPSSGGNSLVFAENGHGAVIGCGGYSVSGIASLLADDGIRKLDCLIVLGTTDQELENAAYLIRNFHPEVVSAKPNVNGFFKKESGRTRLYQGDIDMALWGKITIQTSGQTACVDAGGIRLLVGSGQEGGLSDDFRAAKLAVLSGSPSQGTELSPDCIVLTGDASPKVSGNYYSLQKNGALRAEIRDGQFIWNWDS